MPSGLIVHDITDPYFAAVAAAVLESAEAKGITTTVADTRRQPAREAALLADLRGTDSTCRDHRRQQNDRQSNPAGVPAGSGGLYGLWGKLLMIIEPQPGISTVTVETRAASRKLARKLVDLGHQEFVVLAGPSQVRTSSDRIAGFRRGLSDCGIKLPKEKVFLNGFN